MGVTLTIVRHGNTFADDETPRRIGARTDLPLVESGRVQARALGRAFAATGQRFVRALCSPLARTRETADLILADQSPAPPTEPSDWLAEIDHGPDENQPEDAVRGRIGGAALAAWEARGIAPPGWIVDAELRLAAWRRLFAERHEGDLLLVTSTGAWGRLSLDPQGPRLIAWDVRPEREIELGPCGSRRLR